ncbi:ArfGap-domain-containing protein [Xylaria intraflava]|nr:ArfGap-domain-containing protein [Xylaria intraflava]
MTGLMSKRQQARNERALQDLVHSVPGNNLCADCGARNPSWASWNLGIFLCMRCAAIHRKLGTHISKVKSMSMDSWTNDQVESMKRVGNISSNKIYNPQNKRPPVPIDADEADSAMERFIRSKYIQPPSRTPTNGATKHNTGSSDEGTPPPLPPKTGTRFFKTGTLSFRSKKGPHSPRDSISQQSMPPYDEQLRNKPSKILGASVHQDSLEATAQKLTQLRDMGFGDDQRNAMILKGVNGNLEKTIEALVRLGEGSGMLSPGLASPRDPFSTSSAPASAKPVVNGLSNVGLSKPSPPLPVQRPASSSNDPWEISPAQPQSSQSTGTLQNKNPFYNNNPFGPPIQQASYNLDQSLQNLSLAPPQPPLFPHHTGGSPASQPIPPSTYQHSMTLPVPQMQNIASIAFNSNQTYPPPAQLPQQGYNPFLRSPMTPQQPPPLNTSPYHYQGAITTNPFTRSPTRMASPMLTQIPEQSQQNVYMSSHNPYNANPFMTMSQPAPALQSTQQQWYQQNQQQPQAAQPSHTTQQTNKEAIMALYGHIQTPPAPTHSTGQENPNGFGANQATSAQLQPQSQVSLQPSPSVGTNPFLNNASIPSPSRFAPTDQAATSSARSRESMMLGMEMAWNNGRHSPDAFASLSARSG